MTHVSPTAGRCALITGITGQDGSYLAELLLAKGYEVHGVLRRGSTCSTGRIDHLLVDHPGGDHPGGDHADVDHPGGGARLVLHHADLADSSRLVALLSTIVPDEIYHLGAQSHVGLSFDEPESTGDVTGIATMRLLEAVRICGLETRFYQASSAALFGATPPPQDEATAFHPRSPHGVAKLYAYWAARNYREAHGMFAVNGILFNHESPRRGASFVTRKIARAAARIAEGRERHVHLGNLDAVRDWGYAPEYVEGMWRMLQTDEPGDYVLATGTAHTVEDFARLAFGHVGLDWTEHVRFDERHLRPAEVDALIGDPSKAARELDWRPQTFAPELARILVDSELAALAAPAAPVPVLGVARPMAG